MLKISDYMMICEAAAYLGVSTKTLCNWEKTGKLQTLRHPINNFRLYKKEDLDKLLSLINTKQQASK